MDSNTYSNPSPIGPPGCWRCAGWRTGWKGLWRKNWPGSTPRGAAGAEDDLAIGSTAAWLRGRLRMGASVASNSVRTARACSATHPRSRRPSECHPTASKTPRRGLTAGWRRQGCSWTPSTRVENLASHTAPKRVVPSGRRCALPHTAPLPAGVARDRDPPPSVVTQLGTPGNLTVCYAGPRPWPGRTTRPSRALCRASSITNTVSRASAGVTGTGPSSAMAAAICA
jgi:hypothetical protein